MPYTLHSQKGLIEEIDGSYASCINVNVGRGTPSDMWLSGCEVLYQSMTRTLKLNLQKASQYG